ncbi:MAG: group 1 glycosyl transferase [Chloroflexota bacterium]|jgi:glycosyltransferase involved in cell wall biosynthesis|nr:group 1 glycosyl transferase [Chloroflexota bacterium]
MADAAAQDLPTAVASPTIEETRGSDRLQGRIAPFQAGTAYVIAIVAVYVLLIAPRMSSSGLVDRLDRDGSFLVACLLAIAPTPWLAVAARRPSDAALWVLYVAAYVPGIIVPAFVLGTGWVLLPLWLTLAISFAGVISVVGHVRLRLPGPTLPSARYGMLLAVLGLAGSAGIAFFFGVPTSIPGLDQIFGTRSDYRDELAEAGRLAGYAVWWTGGVVAPLLLAYGVWSRRPAFIVGGVLALSFVYATTAFRSMLFLLPLVVAVLVLVGRQRDRFGVWFAWATTFLVVGTAIVAALGWIFPASMLVRRAIAVPGQILAYYYEFFSREPPYLLSHSVLEGLTPQPFVETPPALIGLRYFEDPFVNANGNLWADGIANFGLAGIVVASVVLAVVLIGLDAVSVAKPPLITITVVAVGVWGLTNSGALTTLLTHGLLLTGVLLWLLPTERTQHRRRPGPWRVVHVSTVHRSDDPRILRKECQTLAEAGYSVTFIGQGLPPIDLGDVAFVSIGEVQHRLARIVIMPMRVVRAVWRIRPDLVHLHDPELLVVGALFRILGMRVVYDAHEDLPSQVAYKPYLPPWARPLISQAARIGILVAGRMVSGVVAATPHVARRFPADQTVVVQNFPLRREFADLEPMRYAERPMTVAYVGRVTEAVGGLVMADAVRGLRHRPHLRVVIAGPMDGAVSAAVASVAEPAGAGAPAIEAPGWLDRSEVIGLLGATRVGLVVFQPVENYIDAQPTKLFEYLASGVPVVASDFPVWREIVGAVDAGLLVDPTDPAAVAAAIDALLDDPERAEAMGRRGRAAVLERYMWDDQGARLVALYRRLMPSPPVPERSSDGRSLAGEGDRITTGDAEHALQRTDLRLLLVTSLYPTSDRPDVGPFVEGRVRSARATGTTMRVVAATSYRGPVVIRYLQLAWAACTARGRFDGVETHVFFPTGLIGMVAARLRSLPHVVYAHGTDLAVSAQRSWLRRRLARLVARSASRVVANSEHTAAMVRRLGIEPLIVSPGVDTARFQPGDRRAARDATGLPQDARVALFCGRMIALKGAETFAQALADLDGWLGVMVGSGELAPVIAQRYPGIRLVGGVPYDAVPDWIRSADVVVVPSRRESLGLVAIEALAAGVPVIASRVGGLPESVQDGRTGILIPSGDPGAIVAALRSLEDVERREGFAAAAPASIARHSLDQSTKAMDAIWSSLVP